MRACRSGTAARKTKTLTRQSLLSATPGRLCQQDVHSRGTVCLRLLQVSGAVAATNWQLCSPDACYSATWYVLTSDCSRKFAQVFEGVPQLRQGMAEKLVESSVPFLVMPFCVLNPRSTLLEFGQAWLRWGLLGTLPSGASQVEGKRDITCFSQPTKGNEGRHAIFLVSCFPTVNFGPGS